MKVIVLAAVMALGLSAQESEKLKTAEKKADMELLKRVDAQMQVIQAQIERTVQPILAEKEEAMKRLCASAGIDRKECEVDANAGTVSKAKKPEPKPSKE